MKHDLFWNIEVEWSLTFKRLYDSWFRSYNVCIWHNLYSLSYLVWLSNFTYKQAKDMLYKDTHTWLLKLINKEVLYHLFRVWNTAALCSKKESKEIIESVLSDIEIKFLLNWIIIKLFNDWGDLAITININPKFN